MPLYTLFLLPKCPPPHTSPTWKIAACPSRNDQRVFSFAKSCLISLCRADHPLLLFFKPLSLYFITTLVLLVCSWAKIKENLDTKECRRVSKIRENGNGPLAVSCDCRGLTSSAGKRVKKDIKLRFLLKVEWTRFADCLLEGERKGTTRHGP